MILTIRHLDILPSVDIIKVDFSKFDKDETEKIVSIAKKLNKKLAAYNVDNEQARNLAKEYDFDYIQGQAIAELESSKIKKLDHLQSTFFRLMVAVTRRSPNFDENLQLIRSTFRLPFRLSKWLTPRTSPYPTR